MKIKLVSDLHLEFADIQIKNDNNYDVLILGGDIMVADHLKRAKPMSMAWAGEAVVDSMSYRQQAALRYREFLKRCSFQFPHVIFIAGNHEFYDGKWAETLDILRQECEEPFNNIYFLEQDTKVIDDVTFVGGTLWTDMNKGDPLTMHAIEGMMNDFKIIRVEHAGYRPLKAADIMDRHRRTKAYIKEVVESDPLKKYVVVGHHSPSFASVHEMYAKETIMNAGYHSNMNEFILDHPQIKLWTHGHTHFPFDYMLGTTRVVCNPRGYDGYEESGWNPNILLEI